MNFEAELVHRFRPLGKGVPKDEEWRFRNSQLSTRVKDVEYSLSYLKEVWGPQNRLDLERVSVVGHSFGGGTAAMAIREIKDIVRGISLDGENFIFLSLSCDAHPLSTLGWLFPLKNVDVGTEAEGELALRDKHFLFSNSDLWQWKENLDRMRNLCSASSLPSSPNSNNWQMVTIKGTTHHSFDDVPLWFSNFLSQKVLKLAGPNLDQRSALEIIGQTSALYLKKDILDFLASSSASSSSSFVELLKRDRTQKTDVPLVVGLKTELTEEVERLWIKHLKNPRSN
jgi:pimeloyl-ACP methyl ester carboxylesterase